MEELLTVKNEEENEKNESEIGRPLLRAQTVYLYMGSEARVSRSTRAQWLLEHLNTVVSIPTFDSLDKINKVIEIVSIIPEEHGLVDWKPDTAHSFKYYIHPNTQLYFLSRRYCLIYCLDMSPSLSTVDIQNGDVMIDKVFTCLKTSLEGVSKSFVLPASTIVFHPEIYVTIIANTPFFTTPAQQVLVQGWHITSDNLVDLFKNIQAELLKLENAVAEVSQLHIDQLEARRIEYDKIVGGLFEEGDSVQPSPAVAMVNPDQGFINMLRFGMLALRLLPAASCASIIVVTDGVITLPDAHLLEATLNRFRTTGVCCSFLHVGSPFHPHGAQARVPYSDLMHFVASASLGIHMTNIPEATILDFRDLQMNRYHKAFLSWSFQSFGSAKQENLNVQLSQWYLSNPSFCSGEDLQLLRKKQLEDTLSVPLVKLLCCRIREGYIIKNIDISENQVKIKLFLAWKHQVHIEYNIRSLWPLNCHSVHYSLFIKAPYDFLHDITCFSKKPFQSSFRQAVVARFWNTLKTLTQSDYLLVHLHSQENNPSWHAVPESIRSGMPLFYLSTNVGLNSPIVNTSDVSNPQFAQFWKPISLLDPDAWHKWLHTHHIGLILGHDFPLPKHLHLANSSGRFQVIQCRQAATTLQSFLRSISTFVLVDNQSFVKVFPPDENSSGWFYIIRITSKPPCVVINIAFPCGISSQTRLKLVSDLKSQLCELLCPSRLSPKERRMLDRENLRNNEHAPVSRTSSKVKCCIVLQKPVEKILIRYERMPSTFDTVVFPDGTQPLISAKSLVTESGKAGYLVTTLSRYLHHKRWIWSAQCDPSSSFGTAGIACILSTITKMRLEEGFSFSHSHAGIVNMLLEVQMQGDPELGEEVSRCVLQYVVFPPHAKIEENKTNGEGDEQDDEGEGMFQIITESWVEPHCGLVVGGPSRRAYMDQLPYNKLSDAIANVDAKCISSLLTFEQLNLMSKNKNVAPPANMSVMTDTSQLADQVIVYHDGVSISDERIHYVPFLFNLLNILPNCRQAELLFSMPVQDLSSNWQVSSKLVENKDSLNPDVKNSSLMELIFDQLSKLHDRELPLTHEDSKHFVEHLHQRERDLEVHPIPIPKLGVQNGTDITSEGSTPCWKCFIKSITSSHITLTFIPASYSDLKSLMFSTTTIDESKPLKILTLEDNNISDFVDWNRRGQSLSSVDRIQLNSDGPNNLIPDSARNSSNSIANIDDKKSTPIPPANSSRHNSMDMRSKNLIAQDSLFEGFSKVISPLQGIDPELNDSVGDPLRIDSQSNTSQDLEKESFSQKSYNSTAIQSSLDNLIISPTVDINLENVSSCPVFDTPKSASSQPETFESSDSSLHRVFNAMAKPYRVRASSLDTNFGRTLGRNPHKPSLRTTSMEAKIWGNRSVNPSTTVSETSGVTRSNTQASEYSAEHVDKSSNLDTNSEDILPSGDLMERNEIQDSSKVFSTILLPIFIYDCPLSNLLDTIVYKDCKRVVNE